MELIEHYEVTNPSGEPSVTFSAIPQTYADLYLVASTRTTGGGPDCLIYLNSDRTNLSGQRLRGNGSNTLASAESPYLENNISTTTASTFASGAAYISNYASNNYKSISTDAVRETNATDSRQAIMGGVWASTAAITEIQIAPTSDNFAQYSSFTLYGIPRYGTSKVPKAIGGITSYDAANNKWVHVFTASGTFTPTENLTAEYLVIAGGGSGLSDTAAGVASGGGGAGGYRSSVTGESSGGGASAESALSLIASTGYTVTVGAGGSSAGSGSNGANSTFSTITSDGGGRGGGYTGVYQAASSGGSGGGGAYNTQTGGSGTTDQGYAGGNATSGAEAGAGGGGAGAVGASITSSTAGGNGGAGLASSITGSSIIRAAGGGGGADQLYPTPGVGGAGGGGTGGTYSPATNGGAGSPGTGSGGGGGGGNYPSAGISQGGNGGSGVVIVRYSA